ncbi:hypothetical protein GIY56_09500 [Paracoccus sp. YIM 132242]|uniref:Uncharacterized protein n=1 Tax=Paracoccus lichenicola TaxID=2665644 RepID=A0A6L6HQ53_9RHOB|nr:hypothetical protein [Paracoccus lichenicola]MTE00522.1 hypothetical protein [Paracoccus lichenicola]
MDRTEFITATALVLFGAFVLGWFACWLIGRLTRPTHADLQDLERKLRDTERERDKAIALIQDRESRLATVQAELETAMGGLRESRAEIEELRDYIERKLARR